MSGTVVLTRNQDWEADTDSKLGEAVDLLLNLASKTLVLGGHVTCLFAVGEEDMVYPAEILKEPRPIQKETGQEVHVKYMDDNSTAWADTSVVDDPVIYSIDSYLDEYLDTGKIPPFKGVLRLWFELPGMNLACRVFFITNTKMKKLCTTKEIIGLSGGLGIPMPEISGFKYTIDDDQNGKWVKTSQSGGVVMQTTRFTPSMTSTTTSLTKHNVASAKTDTPKKSHEASATTDTPSRSSKKRGNSSPQRGEHNPSKRKTVVDMEKVAEFFKYGLQYNQDQTFKEAIDKMSFSAVLSDSGNQSMKQLFEKVKEDNKK